MLKVINGYAEELLAGAEELLLGSGSRQSVIAVFWVIRTVLFPIEDHGLVRTVIKRQGALGSYLEVGDDDSRRVVVD